MAAAPEDIEVVQAITDQLLEIPDDPALGLHVVAVPANLEVDDVARRIEQLMQERERSLGDAAGPDDRVVVEAEENQGEGTLSDGSGPPERVTTHDAVRLVIL